MIEMTSETSVVVDVLFAGWVTTIEMADSEVFVVVDV
jgi:hypothetical protein